MDYPDFEIIILPDEEETVPSGAILKKGNASVRVIPTGPVSPPEKRDIGLKHANGDILAFLDDDAWPEKDWIKKAVENFKDEGIAAVGGPAITCPNDNLRQKAGGEVYASILTSGKFVYRYVQKKRQEVDDFPTCNLFVRKHIMQQLGGFNTCLWPGEDTKLCLDITKKLGKKIIYEPKVLAYHHRRALFIPHIKQVANYALHRGWFVKKYPQTSLKPVYFIPSLFLCALFLGGVSSLFLMPLRAIYLLGLSLYAAIIFLFSVRRHLGLTVLVFEGIIATHLTYGMYFLKGLFLKKLPEEK